MKITGLFIYPVKSLRGIAVPAAQVDELGLVGDRRFMVVDEQGQFLTQRTMPRMAQITTALAATQLTLSADDHGALTLSTLANPSALLRPVNLWRHDGLLAEDCGDAAAQWLSDVLTTRCRLVRIGSRFQRPVLKPAAQPHDQLAFADGAPLLISSEASLNELNRRIEQNGGQSVPMNRFRPNIVVSGCEPFAEDTWPTIVVNGVALRNAGPSDRCLMTTTDQLTGQRMGKEPLKTLASFRRINPADTSAVFFGCNYLNATKAGSLHVGDACIIMR
jgi:uncharacterized protein